MTLASLRPTRWDLRAAAQTAALGLLLFVVACAIGGATDEGGVAWATRVARTLPVVPVVGGTVAYLALRRAARRGELLALESIGCSPARSAAFVALGAAALSFAAAASVVAFRARAEVAFFPRAVAKAEVGVAPGGGFVDPARGVHIDARGVITRGAPARTAARRPGSGRVATAAGILVALGVALPLLGAMAARRRDPRAFGVAAGMCAFCIFLLQAAAAGRVAPWLASAPAGALLIFAALRYRSPTW